MRSYLPAILSVLAAVQPFVSAQLSGRVGPTTSTASKAAKKVCNILDYGGVASKTHDNSAAITAAWTACAGGGEVLIPAGDYGLAKWVNLTHGKSISINLEGIIYRTGTAGGNMIFIGQTTDFEFYSGNSKGAVQGYGYQFHSKGKGNYGPRIMRLNHVVDFSIHDIALVDSPAFHLTFDTCQNGELYNSIIRGGNEGGLDGVDIVGSNIWVHDVEVTNKDECVTVKSPSDHILVESVFCNWSGGSAIGSLSTGTDISDVMYDHIYSQNCNQMFMIKSNGGSGKLQNAVFQNFMGHSNAYTLDLDAQWSSQKVGAGNGVYYNNLTFSHWHGTAANGVQRPVIRVVCPEKTPCTNIDIAAFQVWTEAGKAVEYLCANAYGSGPCVRAENQAKAVYTASATVTSVAGYAIQTMPGELKAGLGITKAIDIPPVPTTFFPGLKPTSALVAR